MAESEVAYLCLAVFTVGGLLAVVAFHMMAWLPFAVERGVFSHTQRENWAFYDLDIINVDWMLYTWIAIYSLQLIWLIYSLIAVCRETKYGSLVLNPPIMPTSLFVSYIPGLACTVGWLVLFDWREYSAYSSVSMMAATVFLCITMALTLHALQVYEEAAKAEGFLADVWTVRIMVQNSLSIYATWCAVVTCYSVAIVMYGFNMMEKNLAQYVTLGILMLFLLLWAGLDLFVAKYMTHFVLGPYLVFVYIFLQTFFIHYAELSTYFVLSSVFVGFTVLLLCVKLVIMFGRCCCKPERLSIIDDAEFCAVEYDSSTEDGGNGSHIDAYSERSNSKRSKTSEISELAEREDCEGKESSVTETSAPY